MHQQSIKVSRILPHLYVLTCIPRTLRVFEPGNLLRTVVKGSDDRTSIHGQIFSQSIWQLQLVYIHPPRITMYRSQEPRWDVVTPKGVNDFLDDL